MGRKKNPAGSRLSFPQYEPSLPVEHGEIAIRLNQDIFRIKIGKQTNKDIMYADDALLSPSFRSTLEGFERTKRKEATREGAFLPFQEGNGSCSGTPCSRETFQRNQLEIANALPEAWYQILSPAAGH